MSIWDPHEPLEFSERANHAFLRALLPEPEVLLAALAPEGWTRCPLHRVFHPSAEQSAEEVRQIRRVVEEFSRREGVDSSRQAGAVDEEAPFHAPASRDIVPYPEREVVELLGMAFWDIFSDGNSVVDAEGRVHDLGSYRGAAGFIAEVFEERYPRFGRRDYLDFYMGTVLVRHRADLRPVYRWIFARLREAGRDWRYVFPRLYVVRLDEEEERSFEEYDPSAAVHAELDRGKKQEDFRALEDELDRAHDEAMERARRMPPPPAIAAYRDVYGVLPEGWPSEQE